MTYNEIRKLKLLNTNQTIPTLKEVLKTPLSNFGTIGWERGKDYIENFGFLSPADDNLDLTYITTFKSTDLRKQIDTISINEETNLGLGTPAKIIFVFSAAANDNIYSNER